MPDIVKVDGVWSPTVLDVNEERNLLGTHTCMSGLDALEQIVDDGFYGDTTWDTEGREKGGWI